MPKSPIMERFKAAAAEGAAAELKLRVLTGKVPGLEKYAHQKHLEDIEDELAKHFGAAALGRGKRNAAFVPPTSEQGASQRFLRGCGRSSKN